MQRFGAWSLILVLVDYSGHLDFGIRTSLVKYVSEYHAIGEHKVINSIVSTGFLFYLLSTMIGAGFVYIFSDGVLRFFRVSPEIYEEAHFALIITAGVLTLSSVSGVFQAIMTGLQRMEVINVTVIITSVLNITGTIVSLELGYGLRGLIINQFVVAMVTAALLGIYSFRLLPALKLSPGFLRIASLQRLLGYGIKVQVTNVGALVSLQTNKILAGYFLGLGSVTVYELGFKVAYTVLSLPMLLISAIMPAASELEARQDREPLRQLYLRGSKYLVLVAAPLAFFTISRASSIMLAWMGPGYENSVLVIQLLTGGFFISLLTGVGTTVARGIGKPGYETRYALTTIVINVVLGIVLIVKIGLLGVLIATLLALAIGSFYFMILFHRHLKQPVIEFGKKTYRKPIVACLLASFVVYGLSLFVKSLSPPWSRSVNLVVLGVEGCIFVGIYLIAILKSRYLDSYDQEFILKVMKWLALFKNSDQSNQMHDSKR